MTAINQSKYGTTPAACPACGNADKHEHSVACLYEYALARLGLEDSESLRVIFWDAHDALEWDEKADWYLVPVREGGVL